jgi:hypothetical protein
MENNNKMMSDQIDQLATALAKAQGEYLVANKDKNNPFFKSKYADFESVVVASRPALSKYGLSVVQPPFIYGNTQDEPSYLVTVVMHSSGQWLKSKARHNPPKNDIQSLSSYNTYLKRMCYASLLGVVTGESYSDDDGNEASIAQYKYPTKLSYTQVQQLRTLSEERQQQILDFSNVNNLDELTVDMYDRFKSNSKFKQS